MKKELLIISAFFITILSLTVLHVVIANRLSTTGVELYKIQQELSAVKKENTIISEEVLSRSSLFYIASRAAELGFVAPKNTIILDKKPMPLAKK